MAVIGVCTLAAAACSFSIGDTATNGAESLIEGDLADELGLSGLEADCEVIVSPEPGDTFTCTSDSEIGEIEWLATVEDDETVNVESTNLVTAEGMDLIESGATGIVVDEYGVAVDGMECGSGPVVVNPDTALSCEMNALGSAYSATVTVTDFAAGDIQVIVPDEFIELAAAPVDDGGDTTDASTDEGTDDDTGTVIDGVETPAELAAALIEGDLAVQAGLTGVEAACDVAQTFDVGQQFECVSTTDIGLVQWIVDITGPTSVNVNSTNLVTADNVTAIEVEALSIIETNTGQTFGIENYDCGDSPVVIDIDPILDCTLTDPANGDVYDSEVEITDPDTGSFVVSVSDTPR
ncbi:MAG: hypothetical protein AAF467_03800 [Actinomycetota bacterium]